MGSGGVQGGGGACPAAASGGAGGWCGVGIGARPAESTTAALAGLLTASCRRQPPVHPLALLSPPPPTHTHTCTPRRSCPTAPPAVATSTCCCWATPPPPSPSSSSSPPRCSAGQRKKMQPAAAPPPVGHTARAWGRACLARRARPPTPRPPPHAGRAHRGLHLGQGLLSRRPDRLRGAGDPPPPRSPPPLLPRWAAAAAAACSLQLGRCLPPGRWWLRAPRHCAERPPQRPALAPPGWRRRPAVAAHGSRPSLCRLCHPAHCCATQLPQLPPPPGTRTPPRASSTWRAAPWCWRTTASAASTSSTRCGPRTG
jgi:hypothetical protein